MTATMNPEALALAAWPIFGGTAPITPTGIATTGDLVAKTIDGVDFHAVWDEFLAVTTEWNQHRKSITDLLSFATVQSAEPVPQNFSTSTFEKATDLGVPKGALPGNAILVGFDRDDYDLASRMSYRFLRDSDIRAVRGLMDTIVEADSKLTNGLILHRLFSNARGMNQEGVTVYGVYDGAAPSPPPYLGRTFPGDTSHYLPTAASVLDSGDIEGAVRMVKRHGFGTQDGSRIIVFANPDESELIQSWRAGEESREPEGSETDGPVARHDFIPADGAAPFLSPSGELIGTQVPNEFGGVTVLGSYGEALLVESNFVPSGYVGVAASYGPNSVRNVVGFREHPNQLGLTLFPGNWQNYPIIESFAARACGVGVRHRGAAVCLQVTTGSTYTAPPRSAFGLA